MIEGLLVNVLVLLGALLVLNKFSHMTITNGERVADISGLGKTAVGFILISMANALPELSVAVFSAANVESVGIAVGNALGSNIVNILLVLGVCIVYASWRNPSCLEFLVLVSREDIKKLQLSLFITSLIPLTLIYMGYASRLIGALLILVFLYNTYRVAVSDLGFKDEGALGEEKTHLARYIMLMVLGASGVVGSSYFIVENATIIAVSFGIPKVVIGATIIAIGTSLPELATSLVATRRGHLNLALGSIVGSSMINITLVLGTTIFLAGFNVNILAFTNLAVFSLIANLFLWYFLNGDRVCWRDGAVLLVLYAIFLVTELQSYLL